MINNNSVSNILKIYDFCIYTDGGSADNGHAGAAAIIISKSNKQKIVAFLGSATDAEAELFATLLGFSYLHSINKSINAKVLWCSDNQTAVKTASDYLKIWRANNWQTNANTTVKNINMWKTYLYLTKDILVTAEYVKAHSGNQYNEACDRACSWMINKGEKFLNAVGPGKIGRNKLVDPQNAWRLVDGREFIQQLRLSGETELDLANFILKLSSHHL